MFSLLSDTTSLPDLKPPVRSLLSLSKAVTADRAMPLDRRVVSNHLEAELDALEEDELTEEEQAETA